MAASSGDKSDKKMPKKALDQQEIIQGFNALRQEQRMLTGKLCDIEMEFNEHRLVVGTLEKVDGGRRCYRMIGGVLVERTVAEILPTVKSNRDNLEKLMDSINQKIVEKGKEINAYKEQHNIVTKASGAQSQGENQTPTGPTAQPGVLVEASNKT